MKKVIIVISILFIIFNYAFSQKKEIVIEVWQNNEQCHCTNIKVNFLTKVIKANKNGIIIIDSDFSQQGDIAFQINNQLFSFSNLKFEAKGVGTKWKIHFEFPLKIENPKSTKYTYTFLQGNGAQITEESLGIVPPIKCKNKK